MQHFDDFGCCMFCQIIEEEPEMEEQRRVVLTREHFVAAEVFASPAPFCTHIYPRRHLANFSDVSSKEIADLARVLRTVLAKLYVGLDNPRLQFHQPHRAHRVRRRTLLPLVDERDPTADAHRRVRTRFGNVH